MNNMREEYKAAILEDLVSGNVTSCQALVYEDPNNDELLAKFDAWIGRTKRFEIAEMSFAERTYCSLNDYKDALEGARRESVLVAVVTGILLLGMIYIAVVLIREK